MSDSRGIVRQNSYDTASEGDWIANRANRRGEIIVPDWMTQLAVDGRVFNISHAAEEAGDLCGETAPGTDNVNPSILVDVPTGTTIIPLEVLIGVEGTGTAGDWLVSISTDDGVRYSSGGSARTPRNMAKDDPNTSGCSAYSGATQIVAIANVDDDTIWFRRIDQAALGDSGNDNTVFWSAKQFTPPILIGPASLLIYVIVGNVDNEVLFSVKWAEFSTSNVIQART